MGDSQAAVLYIQEDGFKSSSSRKGRSGAAFRLRLSSVDRRLAGAGCGTALQKRWGRAALLFISITSMFALGLMMQGKLYAPNTGDVLDMLGFAGDFGAGLLYVAGRAMDLGHGAVQIATADYGTKFIVVSGLLNVIAAV